MNEKISIIVPVYNEEKTIKEIIMKLVNVKFPIEREIIIVNDGSSDKTEEILRELKTLKLEKIKIVSYKSNRGKGYAVRAGLKYATGSIIGIQDADLEYDPNEYPKLLEPILKKECKVVYGTRFNKKSKKNIFYYGNKFLSLITSLLYFSWVSDMETCYKVFRREILDGIKLNSNGFEFEPEITAKILKKYKIKEIPINYSPRSKKEGKKIRIRDGIKALFTLIKYRFID
ncbi:MAG: glycosyltransferase family 2 protein [Candidatus Pacearchaeota archaeon]